MGIQEEINPEYVQKIEKENEVLRAKMLDVYGKRGWYYGECYLDTTCHQVGMNGGCGPTCPLFAAGECETPEEILDHLKEVIGYYDEDNSGQVDR